MSPKLHNPVIKEVFEELLKNKPFESDYNNFLKVQGLIFSSKECLACFIELLREVKNVTFNPHLSIALNNCSLVAESFPLGFWKQMVLFIPELIISKFNEADHMHMIETIEHSTRLCKVEACIDLNLDAWRYLLDTSVKEIAATFRSLIDIGTLDEQLYEKIETVEAFIHKVTHITDRESEYGAFDGQHNDENVEVSTQNARDLFQEFLVNFRIPCKFLKIMWTNTWMSFFETVVINADTAVLPVVEKLVLKFNDFEEIPQVFELSITHNLEAIGRIFPNLKELEIELKIDDKEKDCFGDNFVPNIPFLQIVVNKFTTEIEKANISYKFSFHYCRTNYIDWPHDDVLSMENAFTALNFVAEDITEISQKWVYTCQISDIKDLKVTFLLDDVECNSDLYNDMLDDLDIGLEDNYYTYGEDEIDYDVYDDAGLDFDY
uniref:Uncharacterized protein n=1 Tax=Panagrolaimus superbus TaxID=310955 RepID=A0A914YC57_9BILA